MRGRTVTLAAALASALVVASLAAGMLGVPFSSNDASPADNANASTAHTQGIDEAGHDHAGHDHNGTDQAQDNAPSVHDNADLKPVRPTHEHLLCCEDGQIPTRAEASELEHQLRDFLVEGNDGLHEMRERGYLEGEGTLEDPYVIEDFRVTQDLTITDTDLPLIVRNSYIEGQLTLNFAGEDVYVHHNYVKDLRVNENIERDGPTTAGLFEKNEIAFIGQLRHFGGEFRHNEIGPRPDNVIEEYLSDTGIQTLPEELVWNFDGYHLGSVHNNTVDGRTDVKLHGHFHGSCQMCGAHDHAMEAGFPEDNERPEGGDPVSPHSYRYHTLDFENNTIRAPDASHALRFYDENHAGDDQTANSEPNAYLEDRHEHHQYVRIANNEIRQGGFELDIVNADDERHQGLVQEARIDLINNKVQIKKTSGSGLLAAYAVHAADNLRLVAEDNAFVFTQDDSGNEGVIPAGYRWLVKQDPREATGFYLDTVNASDIRIAGTVGEGADYGLTETQIRDSTTVTLADNEFNAAKEERHDA